MKEPAIDFCLLIPCYNNYVGLIESLNSVKYSSEKYHILIVDDGSTTAIDTSQIEKETKLIGLVTVLRNESNRGITYSLNRGLEWILNNTNATYIARLDSGDTCSENRFTTQINYLNANPAVGLVGSYCQFIDKSTGKSYTYKAPTEHRRIAKGMHFRNLFIHSTIVFRTSMLDKVGMYPYNFELAEDYAFCWMLMNNTQTFISNDILILYEINRSGLSYRNRRKQLKARFKVVSHFSKSPILKILSYFRLLILSLLPQSFILFIKQLKD